jgi:bacteriocin biosynthesis cyclodehydratase domain-containing protein
MTEALPSRPLLNPALRRVWRDQETLQLGIEPRHAVVLRGVGRAEETVLELLDGTRDVDTIVADAAARGVDELTVRRLLVAVARARVIDDGAMQPLGNERDRQRLAPDALSVALLDRTPGAAARALVARKAATVSVHGVGRIGTTVVALLAAAGVGRVVCLDDGPVRAADLTPAGADEPDGTTRVEAAVARGQAKYGAERVVAKTTAPAALAIVAPVGCMPAPEVVASVRDVPHLFVQVRETAALIGPLVVPGRSTCWRCVQIARTDRDPCWPALAAQLTGVTPPVEPADVALCSFAASLGVAHALGWLDREAGVRSAVVPSLNGIVELDLSDGRLRRRSLAPHPECGCGAGDAHALSTVPSLHDRSA